MGMSRVAALVLIIAGILMLGYPMLSFTTREKVVDVGPIQVTKDKKQIRIFLDELEPGTGRYQDEPEIQCGIFCEKAQKEYA